MTDPRAFAERYTAAWCSQDAASVAAHYAEHGSLTINGGVPAIGREAITASAQSFMTAFPDLVITIDDCTATNGKTIYAWTLTGTNTGPGGSGRRVRISGREEWTFDAAGLVAHSLGYFDAADYQRQLNG